MVAETNLSLMMQSESVEYCISSNLLIVLRDFMLDVYSTSIFEQPSSAIYWGVFGFTVILLSLEGDDPLPESLLPLCDELQLVVSSMSNLVNKMNKWSESVMSVRELLTVQHKQTDIIFQVSIPGYNSYSITSNQGHWSWCVTTWHARILEIVLVSVDENILLSKGLQILATKYIDFLFWPHRSEIGSCNSNLTWPDMQHEYFFGRLCRCILGM